MVKGPTSRSNMLIFLVLTVHSFMTLRKKYFVIKWAVLSKWIQNVLPGNSPELATAINSRQWRADGGKKGINCLSISRVCRWLDCFQQMHTCWRSTPVHVFEMRTRRGVDILTKKHFADQRLPISPVNWNFPSSTLQLHGALIGGWRKTVEHERSLFYGKFCFYRHSVSIY